jgi:hypothetical protein
MVIVAAIIGTVVIGAIALCLVLRFQRHLSSSKTSELTNTAGWSVGCVPRGFVLTKEEEMP